VLLLQVSLPCCLFSNGPRHLLLKGGTNADMAPPIDYMLRVFLPALKSFGVSVQCNLNKRYKVSDIKFPDLKLNGN